MKFWGVLYIDFGVGFIFKLYCIIGCNFSSFIIFVLIVYFGMFENFKDLYIEYELLLVLCWRGLIKL